MLFTYAGHQPAGKRSCPNCYWTTTSRIRATQIPVSTPLLLYILLQPSRRLFLHLSSFKSVETSVASTPGGNTYKETRHTTRGLTIPLKTPCALSPLPNGLILRDTLIPGIIFCFCGSPSSGVEEDDHENRFTPVTFSPAQRITLTPRLDEHSPNIGLFYTEDKFRGAVSLLTTNKFDEPFTIDKVAMDYIDDLTNGHPGG